MGSDGRDRVSELLEASAVLTDTSSSIDDRLRRLCDIARRCCFCDRSSIFLRSGDRFRARFNSGNPPDVAAAFEGFSMGEANPIVRQLVETHALVVENRARHRPGLRSVAEVARLHSIAIAPMTDGEMLVGFLTVEQNERELDIDAMTAEIAEGLAHMAWNLWHTTDLEERRRATIDSELLTEARNRRRLADRLHDGPQQTLVGLGLRLQVAAEQADGALREELRVMVDYAEDARRDLRDLILDLDAFVGHRVVDGTLRTMLERHASIAGWTPTFHADGTWDDLGLDIALTLERLAREALANVRDHAGATRVELVLRRDDDGVGLGIADNGGGLPEDLDTQDPGHRGLLAMQERCRMLGGSIAWGRSHLGGTQVEVALPVET